MTFEELQNEVTAICQPIIEAYETEIEKFNAYAADRGLLTAIEWRTDDVAMAAGKAGEAIGWLDSFAEASADTFDADYCLKRIERDYRFGFRIASSTNPIANAIENNKTLGRQAFIRDGLRFSSDAPLVQIEKAVRKYQEAL